MLDIFQYSFITNAFIAGIMIAIIAPIIGTFLILRRYALFADTLAHFSLLGVAISGLLNINPLIPVLALSVLGSISIECLRFRAKMSGDVILAFFITSSLAIATIIISLTKGLNAAFLNILFGSILTVQKFDLYLIGILSVIVLITIYIFYKELFFITFDEEIARAAGLPVNRIKLLLITLAGITVSLSVGIVGTLLISALMIIPGMTAMKFRYGFKKTMLLSVCFSVFCVIGGLLISYYLGIPSGGSIVATLALIFLLVAFIKR